MRLAWPLGIVALGLAAAALLLLPLDLAEEPPAGGATRGPQALVASVAAQPHACSLCHYAWEAPFRFNGTVEETEQGFRYRLSLAPLAAYNLTDVRIVPVFRGDEPVSAFREPVRGSVGLRQSVEIPFHVNVNASAVYVLLAADREFGRSDLRLTLRGPPGELEGIGVGSLRVATWAPAGGLPPGMYSAVVEYVDGAQPQEAFTLLVDSAPGGVHAFPLATAEAPATLDLVFPRAARGFAVQLRPHNEHPADKWLLPNWGDRGELSLFVAEGEPAPARAWSAAEIDRAWGGAREKVLHESAQDGVVVRNRDARGEWTRQSRWITPPGEEAPFAPVPPGTREIVAEITWSGRTPLSPTVTPYFGWSHAPKSPTFYYPEPEVDEPGRRVYRLAVDASWWEDPAQPYGGFQGFALLPTDAQGRTLFDGRWGITLSAVR